MPRFRLWQGCEYARVTQSAEYALITLNMREYALITLNMIEYAGIYLEEQSVGYARILNLSETAHSKRSLYKLLSSYRDRHIWDYCQTFKMKLFCKKNNTQVQVRDEGRGEKWN